MQCAFLSGGSTTDAILIVRKVPCPWWRHQMKTFSALLAICAGNSPVPGEFPTQRPVTRSFDVYFDLRPNKRLSKQSLGWWFEMLSPPLWRHRNAVNKTPYMAFIDLERAFDCVRRHVIWLLLRQFDVEWQVHLIQSVYENDRSKELVVCNPSAEFSVNVGVHQGSCLCPSLFVAVLETLPQKFRTGCSW